MKRPEKPDSARRILLAVLAVGPLARAGPARAAEGARTDAARTVAVGAAMRSLIEADWIERDARFTPEKAAAKSTPAANEHGVTTAQDASGGCDGITNGRWGFHVASGEQDPWWQVDLGRVVRLDRVVIFNRTDRGTADRTRQIRVLVARDEAGSAFEEVYRHNGTTFYGVKEKKPLVVPFKARHVEARIVRLAIPGRCSFALDEIEVYAAGDPGKNIALGRPADQKSVSQYSYPGTLGESADSAAPPSRGGGFTLAHTRDVVARGHGLVTRLRPDAERLDVDRVRPPPQRQEPQQRPGRRPAPHGPDRPETVGKGEHESHVVAFR